MNIDESEVKEIGCIRAAMDVLGPKWTARIIRELAGRPKRFSELERAIEGINPRILCQRITLLEEKEVVVVACGCSPQRPVYELTEKGRGLLPALRSMAEWSKHNS